MTQRRGYSAYSVSRLDALEQRILSLSYPYICAVRWHGRSIVFILLLEPFQ